MVANACKALKQCADGPVRGTLHFVIHGRDLTRIARQRWADEHEPASALKLLSAGMSGATIDQVLGVLTGRSKLTGDSRRGVRLAADRTKRSPCGGLLPSLIHAYPVSADSGVEK